VEAFIGCGSSGLLWRPLPFLLLLAVGCSREHYRQSADKEAYRAIAQKSSQFADMDKQFTIDQTNQISLENLVTVTESDEALGSDTNAEVGAVVLTLDKALDLAVKHSRVYQNNKERLYLQALSLTLVRHRYTPIYSAGARGNYQAEANETREVIDQVTGQGTLGVEWLARTGARLSTAFTTDFLRVLAGDPKTVTSSQVGLELIQPLLRGAGYKVAMENLTQAERDLVYQLRQFILFRREFSVQVATTYFNVLENRDRVRNSYRSLLSFRKNAERTQAFAREGKTTQAQLGRIEQEKLTSEGQWIDAVRSYLQSLDQFKILLGLSTEAKVVLDDRELQGLQIEHSEVKVEDAIQVALATRLDLVTVRNELEDAQRRLYVAGNSLKPQLDAAASASLNSPQKEGGQFALPDLDRYRWNAGLNLDLGLDRKAERNAYRNALIAQEQARRQLALRQDEIRLQIRNGWRVLDQAKRNYEISVLGVKLNERRVEEQDLLAELGRANTQDLVDAQNNLTSSKNQLTQALIGHTIARLQFWNNLGMLYIKEGGQWEERKLVR
jgi:outer membrane protein TolC